MGIEFSPCTASGIIAYFSHVPHFCHPDCAKHDLMLLTGRTERVLVKESHHRDTRAALAWSRDWSELSVWAGDRARKLRLQGGKIVSETPDTRKSPASLEIEEDFDLWPR